MSKILIVEDNELNLDMISRRLARKGYQVIHARDGVQGLAMVRAERPDLVLMDMSLPEMDGWETTRRIRRDEAVGRVPVIALTAHAMEGDREKALAVGCNDYDTKPVEFDRLLGKISALLVNERPPA